MATKNRSNLRNVVTAWRTRRALNCLGNEVQEYVNCEDADMKAKLRDQFHALFDTVLAQKLYMEKNADKLNELIASQ